MPPSLSLRAFGLLTALVIVSAALYVSPADTRHDAYSATVTLLAGTMAAIGSLSLAYAVGGTFLRHGGRGAFKAIYWASYASAGAGFAEAASVIIPVNVSLATSMAALAFAGAGLVALSFAGGI